MILSTQQNLGVWMADYTPTYTGFSANPTVLGSRYTLVGKTCTVYISSTSGTSNTTAKTITLPFAAANTVVQTDTILITNNGTPASGRIITRVNSNIADCYATVGAGAWTGSGSCNIQFSSFTYEIA